VLEIRLANHKNGRARYKKFPDTPDDGFPAAAGIALKLALFYHCSGRKAQAAIILLLAEQCSLVSPSLPERWIVYWHLR